eukprot:6212884-Pleurochrysis_carterae.AAC.1
MFAALPSPRMSLKSVAPPMRQHLPPNSAGSMPHAAAMRLASLREVVLDHAEMPSSAVKKGIVLDPLGSFSAAGMSS